MSIISPFLIKKKNFISQLDRLAMDHVKRQYGQHSHPFVDALVTQICIRNGQGSFDPIDDYTYMLTSNARATHVQVSVSIYPGIKADKCIVHIKGKRCDASCPNSHSLSHFNTEEITKEERYHITSHKQTIRTTLMRLIHVNSEDVDKEGVVARSRKISTRTKKKESKP